MNGQIVRVFRVFIVGEIGITLIYLHLQNKHKAISGGATNDY